MSRRNNGGCVGALVLFMFWILNKLIEFIVDSLEDKSPNVIKGVNILLLVALVIEVIACIYIVSLLGWN